jgi:2-methylcitrate dehydratase PrpD
MTSTHSTKTSHAAVLAETVTSISLDDVPASVVTVARAHLLDAVGLAIASTGMDYGHAVHEAGTRLGSGSDSRVLGFGTPMPAASAALVDGTLIHGLDFDDTHIGAIYHASAPALAAALSVGEAEHADGATVLLAYIVGVEVGCRLAAAGAGKFHARGFHPTGIAGTFAAACVTAKIRDLSAATLTSALGLCGSQAAGILELHESWLKRMHPGWAAHSGIIAVTLAEAGFRGPATVLEGPAGLYASHIGERPSDEDLGLDTLGTRWMTAEVALKPYPCCHFTHAFADAAFSLLDELGADHITADQVDSIICPTAPALLPMVAEPAQRKMAPTTIYDALFSIQYVVACALVGRGVGLATFYDEPLDHPEVLAMAAKVTCIPNAEADFPAHFPGEVILHLTDGRILRRQVAASHGTPEDPLNDSEVLAKFTTNATRRIPANQAARVADFVARFESLPTITGLIDACIVSLP